MFDYNNQQEIKKDEKIVDCGYSESSEMGNTIENNTYNECDKHKLIMFKYLQCNSQKYLY